MKARISKNKFSSDFGCNNLGGKNRESFSMLLFLHICYFPDEHSNSCKNFHGKLKACEIFSCVKFMYKKSKSMTFMKATLAQTGPTEGLASL